MGIGSEYFLSAYYADCRKNIISKEVQDETKEFIQSLLFNKEDYKRLRNLNFLSII